MRLKSFFLSFAVLVLGAGPAFAHSGAGATTSFFAGFQHPFGGADHLLAMFAVGLFAAQLGGRSLWLVPGAFVAAMGAGALLDLAAIDLPGIEYAISVSLVAIALPAAFALGMPAAVAAIYVGIFAIFHGHAHGSELPAGGEVFEYVVGFAAATALIHAAGIGFALGAKSVPARMAAAAVGAFGLTLVFT